MTEPDQLECWGILQGLKRPAQLACPGFLCSMHHSFLNSKQNPFPYSEKAVLYRGVDSSSIFFKNLASQACNNASCVCRYPVQSQLPCPVWGSGYSDESHSGGSEDARADPAGAATATWCGWETVLHE